MNRTTTPSFIHALPLRVTPQIALLGTPGRTLAVVKQTPCNTVGSPQRGTNSGGCVFDGGGRL